MRVDYKVLILFIKKKKKKKKKQLKCKVKKFDLSVFIILSRQMVGQRFVSLANPNRQQGFILGIFFFSQFV